MKVIQIKVPDEKEGFLRQLLSELTFVYEVREVTREQLQWQLLQESRAVAANSMEVLQELEKMEDDYEAI